MEDKRPVMLDGERSDTYARRTGFYPPHWTSDRYLVQDARIREYEEVAGRGLSAKGRATARAYLRRWGS